MPEYVKGVELTQDGMRAIFKRMGQNITSGIIYNGNPDIKVDELNQQGYMPILTGVSPNQESGHWIMLIKGQGNQYHLFDPLGEDSGKSYQSILAKKLPQSATLSVIPNAAGLNMGLCGYWVASASRRVHAALTGEKPPTLEALGQTITKEMRDELAGNGYAEITGWLRAVAHEFPAGVVQPDATTLRRATEKDLHIEIPAPLSIEKGTTPKEIPTTPTASGTATMPLDSTLLASDADVRSVIDYVHKEYLGKPYPGPLKNPKDPKEGRLPPNEGSDRGTHGLAHIVRTMACAEVMVEEARKAKLRGEKLGTAKDGRTLADVTPEELKKILIAQAFFVVGRDDERSGYDEILKRDFYGEYHEASEKAFRKYVEDNKLIGKIFKDQQEVDHYAAIILDEKNSWAQTPAHILINQGHMVDLMRVKAPQEVTVERCYNNLKSPVGSRGAEVVLKTHREFFLATGAVVPLFNPEAKDDPSRGGPFENPYNGEKYAIEEGKDLKSKKDIRLVDSKNPKKDNERFVTIKEYYALPEVQQAFPGCKTYLEPSSYMVPTAFARTCEQNPTACIDAIQQARSKVMMGAIKDGLKSDPQKARRISKIDEIAAAYIIQQIMANPNVIHEDHVLLNGQRLEVQFFRNLLAHCDMTIVGSLLNDTDINNIDHLMQHERNIEFHSTNPQTSPIQLGDKWDQIRQRNSNNKDQIKHDLISLMQNDTQYFNQANAVAQNRESTFKEVLITALLTPLTSKALEDTTPSPKILLRGLNFPEDVQSNLINQANTLIANTENYLFTGLSAQAFMPIKLNDLSKISSQTDPETIFDANTIFEINDPEKLLQAKQVGSHTPDSEDESSFSLPENVALIPTKVTLDGKTATGMDRYIITFIAVKNPDFVPRHEIGFAAEPNFKEQNAKVIEAINAVKTETTEVHENLNEKLKALRLEMVRQFHLPIRGGFLDRILHYFSGKDDQKISLERKNFFHEKVIPVLQECHIALRSNNMDLMRGALAKLPSDTEWSTFQSEAGKAAKKEVGALKVLLEKKIELQSQILPLMQCQDALGKHHVADALQALKNIPSDKDMMNMPSISSRLREQIQRTKQELTENLEPLQRAVITPTITNLEQVRMRYETRIASTAQQIATLNTAKLSDMASIKKGFSHFNAIQEEIKLLRHEKTQMHSGTPKIDFADIEKLEEPLQTIQRKLYIGTTYDAYVVKVAKQIAILEQEKPKNLADVKRMISSFNERLAEVEQLRQGKISKYGAPLDMSDLDKLKDQLQTLNQALVKAMINTISISLNQMEVNTFDEQKKEAQQNLQLLDKLAKTLDDSEPAQKQKAEIQQLKQFFVEKQKAYPAMVQLQFKSETLIIQLRELCEAHQNNLEKQRNTRAQEITKHRGMFQGITDFVRLTTDERITLTNRGKLLEQFKEDLNNDKYDVKHLINNLARRSPAELEEAIGLPKETSEKLHTLLKGLSQSTTFVAKIEQRSKLIDDILVEISKQTMQPELTQTDEELPQHVFSL